MTQSKVFASAQAALFDVPSGARIMSGGFGLSGIAENSIDALATMPIENLTVMSNNVGNSGRGLVKLLKAKKIRKAICSYVGGNPDLEAQMLAKEVEVELVPQGTFAERIRAAGLGIRAFYTPTGVGTMIAQGKEVKNFDKPCLLETALHADYAIIKATKGDPFGNLWFKESTKNFSPLMAMAAKITVAEVEELVPLGALRPEDVHLPGIFVQRIYQGKNYENIIEHLKVAEDLEAADTATPFIGWSKTQMADKVAEFFTPQSTVNLGIGMPTLVADRIPAEKNIFVHSENGILGVWGRPKRAEASPTLINAGKETVAIRAGASFFDSSLSFGMIRGGHIDFCVLGGMEVDVYGNLANWMVPGQKITGMGGAMDLATGAKTVIVMMTHLNKKGESKLVQKATLPLTATSTTNYVVTDLGVFKCEDGRFAILELAPHVSVADLNMPKDILRLT